MTIFDVQDLSNQSRQLFEQFEKSNSYQKVRNKQLLEPTDNQESTLWTRIVSLFEVFQAYKEILKASNYGLNNNAVTEEHWEVFVEKLNNLDAEYTASWFVIPDNFHMHRDLVDVWEVLENVPLRLEDSISVFADFTNEELTVQQVGIAFNFVKFAISEWEHSVIAYEDFLTGKAE